MVFKTDWSTVDPNNLTDSNRVQANVWDQAPWLNAAGAALNAAGGVLNVADRGLPTDGVTDVAPAIAQTVTDAKALARLANGAVRVGLPVIRIPKGRYRIDATILLELLRGVTILGDGMGSTVLYVGTGITLLDLHRVNQVKIKDMTLVASRGAANPGAVPWIDCLIEDSCGVHIRERNDDVAQGVSTTEITFDHVEWIGFHRAVRTSGNQMGDNVTFSDCKWRDNVYDIDSENGQAINWRVIGGEVIGFVDGAEGDYNTLLAAWSAGGRPLTAPTGQRRVPGDTTSALQNVTVRDGAVVRCVAGAGISFYNTSFIAKKTRLLFGGLPTVLATAVATHGVEVNFMPFSFHTCSTEIRDTTVAGTYVPEPRDTFGQDRLSLVRYERPHPASTDKTLQAVVSFVQERIVAQVQAWDAVHLTNGVTVNWSRCQAAGAGVAGARLVSRVTSGGSTAANIGRFVGSDSVLLTRYREGRNPDGTAWTPPPMVEHDIIQEGRLAGTVLAAPAKAYDSTRIPGVVRDRKLLHFAEVDGSLPQATSRRLYLPVGAILLRATVIASFVPAGKIVTLELRKADGSVIGFLTVDMAQTGTITLNANGQKRDLCRVPTVEIHADLADGIVDVVQIATGGTIQVALGTLLVEFL